MGTPWEDNEDGPTCTCGWPTAVKECNGKFFLLCIGHTKAEGAMFDLPPERPDGLPDDPELWPPGLFGPDPNTKGGELMKVGTKLKMPRIALAVICLAAFCWIISCLRIASGQPVQPGDTAAPVVTSESSVESSSRTAEHNELTAKIIGPA